MVAADQVVADPEPRDSARGTERSPGRAATRRRPDRSRPGSVSSCRSRTGLPCSDFGRPVCPARPWCFGRGWPGLNPVRGQLRRSRFRAQDRASGCLVVAPVCSQHVVDALYVDSTVVQPGSSQRRPCEARAIAPLPEPGNPTGPDDPSCLRHGIPPSRYGVDPWGRVAARGGPSRMLCANPRVSPEDSSLPRERRRVGAIGSPAGCLHRVHDVAIQQGVVLLREKATSEPSGRIT